MAYKGNGLEPIGALGSVVISKDDAVNEKFYIRELYVGGTGNIVAVNLDDSTTLISTIPAGARISGHFKRINSTNTTATTMVGYY